MKAFKIARYGMLTAVMLVLGYLESGWVLVPGVPGIRLGLGNCVLLYALFLLGPRSAWLLTGLKVSLSALLFGGAGSFFYSLAGGVCAMLAMGLLFRVKGMGFVGVSVCGAASHMAGQLLMSRALLGSYSAFVLSPWLLLCAIVTGTLTGLCAKGACRALSGRDAAARRALKERQGRKDHAR